MFVSREIFWFRTVLTVLNDGIASNFACSVTQIGRNKSIYCSTLTSHRDSAQPGVVEKQLGGRYRKISAANRDKLFACTIG
jgi:hypothetical protein